MKTLQVLNLTPNTRANCVDHFTTNIAFYQRLAKNIAGQDSDDLFQECTLMLLEFPEERIVSYWNEKEGLKPFFIRLLCNQYKSNTSKFHKEYRKQDRFIQTNGADITYNDQSTEIEPFAIDLGEMTKARDRVHVLNGEMFPNEKEDMVFRLYTETGSLRKTLAAIDPKDAPLFDLKKVHEIVKKFRRTIKKELNKDI
jgi:hypothetical protein